MTSDVVGLTRLARVSPSTGLIELISWFSTVLTHSLDKNATTPRLYTYTDGSSTLLPLPRTQGLRLGAIHAVRIGSPPTRPSCVDTIRMAGSTILAEAAGCVNPCPAAQTAN